MPVDPARTPAKPLLKAVVLLVDDNAHCRFVCRSVLTGQGYTVLEAATAADALAAAQRAPDLIVQDIGLPDVDGWTLVRALRALPGGVDRPIVALTGFASPADPPEGTFDEVLIKPIRASQLLACVQRHLRRGRGAASPPPEADVGESWRAARRGPPSPPIVRDLNRPPSLAPPRIHQPAPPIASCIGRFRIDARLGSGGMGEVYKAFDPNLQRVVALKTVRADIVNEECVERFHREAQACARLQHPNIVTIYESGEAGGVAYIAMEYLTGENLAAELALGRLTFDEKLRTLLQILDALQHAHAHGIVHRDIKPSNVQRTADGSIKLLDFGLARGERDASLTMAKAMIGTPHYASPEQFKGENVDRRSDIYSTGVLAYELFTGRRPFSRSDSDSVTAIMLRVLSEVPQPLSPRDVGRYPQLKLIVARAMAKSVTNRYQSAADMGDAVRRLVDPTSSGVRAARPERASSVARSGPAPARPPSSANVAVPVPPTEGLNPDHTVVNLRAVLARIERSLSQT